MTGHSSKTCTQNATRYCSSTYYLDGKGKAQGKRAEGPRCRLLPKKEQEDSFRRGNATEKNNETDLTRSNPLWKFPKNKRNPDLSIRDEDVPRLPWPRKQGGIRRLDLLLLFSSLLSIFFLLSSSSLSFSSSQPDIRDSCWVLKTRYRRTSRCLTTPTI